jgi:hypothetical protein
MLLRERVNGHRLRRKHSRYYIWPNPDQSHPGCITRTTGNEAIPTISIPRKCIRSGYSWCGETSGLLTRMIPRHSRSLMSIHGGQAPLAKPVSDLMFHAQ